jgi:hypothetical protein
MDTMPADVEGAYVTWAFDADQNVTKTAELTGKPRRTITHWKARYRWADRIRQSAEPDADYIAHLSRDKMKRLSLAMIDRLEHIIVGTVPLRSDDGAVVRSESGAPVMVYAAKDNDAINASKIVAAFSYAEHGYLNEPKGTENGLLIRGVNGPNRSAPMKPGDTPTDLPALHQRNAEILEATYQSVNTRKKRGGRRT